MGVTKEQAMAYTEVIEILKYMPKEEVNKIPRDIMEYYERNKDNSYEYKVDTQKKFEQQSLSQKAKVVLAIFFRDYWATDEQRNKIKNKEKNDLYIAEQEKQKKYSSDVMFKKTEINNNTKLANDNKLTDDSGTTNKKEAIALVNQEKQTWYTKIINFVQGLFKKNK